MAVHEIRSSNWIKLVSLKGPPGLVCLAHLPLTSFSPLLCVCPPAPDPLSAVPPLLDSLSNISSSSASAMPFTQMLLLPWPSCSFVLKALLQIVALYLLELTPSLNNSSTMHSHSSLRLSFKALYHCCNFTFICVTIG